ncbi:hypothetical protein Rsub_04071 [Raphidocelis subcapitata]|uniref:Uncharacterized protein n=1 Tax=Raphidocelis subcapitata TaxID=307507 RepID=A0A2V0P3I1_9CHLO|nr:hypothetical protein Rsub_04071 [Raphidocelis subcapitata]|eukprot:GBF91767.1 hypothetical protein Rsub_04071 [Raphidocelis subcapitata]
MAAEQGAAAAGQSGGAQPGRRASSGAAARQARSRPPSPQKQRGGADEGAALRGAAAHPAAAARPLSSGPHGRVAAPLVPHAVAPQAPAGALRLPLGHPHAPSTGAAARGRSAPALAWGAHPAAAGDARQTAPPCWHTLLAGDDAAAAAAADAARPPTIRPGPLLCESSLYSSWAHGGGGSGGAGDPRASAPAAARAATAGPFPRAATASPPGALQATPPSPPEGTAGGGASHGAKRDAWLRERYPGARPPRREDADSLRLWLEGQLSALQDAPQPPLQPPEAPDSRCAAATGMPAHDEAGEGAPPLDGESSQLLCSPARGGAVDVALMQQQEAVLSAAFGELCRQVAVGCVERGRLLNALWATGRSLLRVALSERDAAQSAAAGRSAAAAEARGETAAVRRRAQEEVTALRVLMERHEARAAEARREAAACRDKNAQLEAAIAKLSVAQQLAARVEELEAAHAAAAADAARLGAALLDASRALEAARAAEVGATARAEAAEAEAERLAAQLGGCTPRPRRDMGLLSDLLTEAELGLVEQALIASVPPEHVHRILLALTPRGSHVAPWGALLGCCRPALDAQPTPEARAALAARLRELLAACDVPGLSAHVGRGAMEALSRAVHLGADRDTLLALMDGSLGADDGACPDCTPFAPLLGALSERYGHDASELGGAVTAALQHAALSTRGRMEELVERSRSLHRRAGVFNT